jgi:hypothetical protein
MNTRLNTLIIALIITAVVIVGIVTSVEVFKTNTNAVIRLSVTAQTSPEGIKVHTQQQLSNIDSGTTVLSNSTLDKNPVLKNAIDQAFSRFVPPPFHGTHTFTTQINQGDADSIIQLAGNKVNQLPETQTSDINFGVNFTTYASTMEFKLNNFYYHVVIEQLIPSQGSQFDNMP